MKAGISTYSFAALLESHKLSWLDIFPLVKEMGYEGVELANITDFDYVQPLDLLGKVACENNLELCGWCSSCSFDNPEKGLQALREEISKAASLGISIVRTDIYHQPTITPYRTEVIAALRTASDDAAKCGITLVTENHGGYFALLPRMEQLMLQVEHPNFGVLLDTGNARYAGQDPRLSLQIIQPWLKQVHLKDYHIKEGALFPGDGYWESSDGSYWRCAALGQGELPVIQLLRSLHSQGYNGWLISEFEGIEDCLWAARTGADYLRRALIHP